VQGVPSPRPAAPPVDRNARRPRDPGGQPPGRAGGMAWTRPATRRRPPSPSARNRSLPRSLLSDPSPGSLTTADPRVMGTLRGVP